MEQSEASRRKKNGRRRRKTQYTTTKATTIAETVLEQMANSTQIAGYNVLLAIVKEYREAAAHTITTIGTIVISVLLFCWKFSIPNSPIHELKSHATFLHSSKSVQTSERAQRVHQRPSTCIP